MSARRRGTTTKGSRMVPPDDPRDDGIPITPNSRNVWSRLSPRTPHLIHCDHETLGNSPTEYREEAAEAGVDVRARLLSRTEIDGHTGTKRKLLRYEFDMFESNNDPEEDYVVRSRDKYKKMDTGFSTTSATATKASVTRLDSTDQEDVIRDDDWQSNRVCRREQDNEHLGITRHHLRYHPDSHKRCYSHNEKASASFGFSEREWPSVHREYGSSASPAGHRHDKGRHMASHDLTRSCQTEQLTSDETVGYLAKGGHQYRRSSHVFTEELPGDIRKVKHRRPASTKPNDEQHNTIKLFGSQDQRPPNPDQQFQLNLKQYGPGTRRLNESLRQEIHAPPKDDFDGSSSREMSFAVAREPFRHGRRENCKRRGSSSTHNERRIKRPRTQSIHLSRSCHFLQFKNSTPQPHKSPRPRQGRRLSPKDVFHDYVSNSGSKTSDETATYLANHLEQLEHYCKDSTRFQQILNVLKLIEHIVGSACCQSVQTVVLCISKNNLFSSAVLEKELMALRVGDADVTEDKLSFMQTLLRAMDHVLKTKMNVGCLDVDYGIIRCSDNVRNIPCFKNSIGTRLALNEDLHKVEADLEQFQNMREEKKKTDTDVLLPGAQSQDQDISIISDRLDITQATILPKTSELTPSRTIFPLVKMQSVRSFDNESHYLESVFNLYREDFVRPLISSICFYCKTCQEEEKPPSAIRGIKMYTGVTVKDSKCANLDGVVYTVEFCTSPFKSMRWNSSKRLKYGSLVCLSSDNFNQVIYATIANRKPEDLKNGLVDLLYLSGPQMASYDEKIFVMIESDAFYPAYSFTLEGLIVIGQRLADLGEPMPLSRYYVQGATDPRPPTYLIQTDNEQITFDFTCLLGSPVTREKKSQDFTSEPSFKSVAVLDENAWPEAKQLLLNASQYDALRAMVTQELPLIQGPPGTGKTFLGWKCLELLLNNMHAWRQDLYSAPILVVCYTNRALDQFLEKAIRFPCIANSPGAPLVRVGSRCLVDSLEKYSLASVRRNHKNTASGKASYNLKERGRLHDYAQSKINRYYSGILHEDFLRKKGVISKQQFSSLVEMVKIHGNRPVTVILDWLDIRPPREGNFSRNNRSMEQECFDDDFDIQEEEDIRRLDIWDDLIDQDEGYVFQSFEEEDMFALSFESIGAELDEEERSVKKEQMAIWRSRLESAVSSSDVLTEEDGKTRCHLWPMELEQRWKLYRAWVKMLSKPAVKELTEIKKNYNRDSKIYTEARRVGDQTILRNAKLIGMTTTGAARNLAAIRAVGSKVVIVEEAAEVPESHVVTALGSSCQHLILIGDHQQLRPSYNDYTLAKENGIDLSLFERLTRNGQNPTTLRVQHRMRPEISRLLVPHIYEELQDHESVMTDENVRGITTNVFFIDHQELERQETHSTSHENLHEARFLLSLALYMLKQGYQPHQITILTTYSGQYFLLSRLYREMHNLENGIKIATVDNYQGEENDIILLSLVRSNRADRIGHLMASNRVCVSLSRARIGLFVIGNFSLLESNSEVWKQVVTKARSFGQVGTSLKLQCQPHGKITSVMRHQDFEPVRDGGCSQSCQYRLKCGHACGRNCHVDDPEHEQPCQKPCKKPLCSNPDHLCDRDCYQCVTGCGPCRVEVVKIVSKCGHSQKVECHAEPENIECNDRCEKRIDCGHKCQRRCHQVCNSSDNCMELVKMVLRCGHENPVPCSCRDTFKCRVPCDKPLSCGHPCKGTCGECKNGRLHQPCRHMCERILLCDHVCGNKCTDYCPPCPKACRMRCEHSKCKKSCCFPCYRCIEKCQWECSRKCPNKFKCEKSCYEDCDRPRCDEHCRKLCPTCKRRPCIGVCGEPCPDVCRNCKPQKLTEHMLSGTEDEADAMFIQLQDCKHLIEMTFLDKWMETNVEDGDQSVGLKGCPVCRQPITSSKRYGNLIRQSVHDMDKVKRKIVEQDYPMEETEERLNELKTGDSSAYKVLQSKLKRCLSVSQLTNLHNQVNFIISLVKLRSTVKSDLEAHCPDLSKKLLVELQDLRKWALLNRYHFSEQEITQFKTEQERVAQMIAFQQLLRELSIKNISLVHVDATSIRDAFDSLDHPETLTETELKTTRAMLKKAREELPEGGLAITHSERLDILKALGFHKKGRWYKCKNGHYYVIGECGGAVEETKCSECSETVGGKNHRIRDDNELAPEMDDDIPH